MRHLRVIKVPASLTAFTLLSGAALAQVANSDYGKDEYDSNCAVCHGNEGKGNGPYVEYLRHQPTDLTTLAKRNGGVLPVGRIYETIAAENVPGHGSPDMPIWGSTYRVQPRDWRGGSSQDRDLYVRSRVLTLVDYIDRMPVR